jgi:hypothetical protein
MSIAPAASCKPATPSAGLAAVASLLVSVLVSALTLAGCAQAPHADAASERWRPARADAVAALESHLVQHGVVSVLPLHELLRSASSWQDCAAEPFALPPPAQWPAVVSVLRLVQALRAAGVIGAIEVHSGYRDAPLNACAGGAARSAHLLHFAIDFTPRAGADPGEALCAFWRREGAGWRMGLGRYASGRIHIDTAGYRSWGAPVAAGAAPCRLMPAAEQAASPASPASPPQPDAR